MSIVTRYLCIPLAIAAISLAHPGIPAWAGTTPFNVVILVADDLGWNDVGYHGSEIETPRIDQLAEEGLELDRFYVQPTCSPTRAALMTGQSPARLGITEPVAKYQEEGLPLELKILPEFFRETGYRTLMVGKWHLGHATHDQQPRARGFDYFYGLLSGGIGYWDHVHGGGVDWQRNGTTVRESGYSTHLLAEDAVKLIQEHDKAQPLFLYASFNAPHMPNEAPEASITRYAHIEDGRRRVHAAMVTELDSAIGSIIDALAEREMLEDTLIWFLSDNGGLNERSLPPGFVNLVRRLTNWFDTPLPVEFLEFSRKNMFESGGDNAPFRRGKTSVYEGGVRVPAFVYWKGQLDNRKVEQRISVQDVLPTLAEAAALSLPQDHLVDGASQWTMMTAGEPGPTPDLFLLGRDGEAYIKGDFKLVLPDGEPAQLFNLREDPVEANDIAAAMPERVAAMAQNVADFPRAESRTPPIWKILWDPDSFGGIEDREPWAERTRH